MADYALSRKADADLTGIYIFSHKRFREATADAYLLSLEESFLTLARNPNLGRKIDHIRKGYFRYEYASHTIFYKIKKDGIVVMRVLYKKMETERHL